MISLHATFQPIAIVLLNTQFFFPDVRLCAVPDFSIDGSYFIFLDYNTKNLKDLK